MSDETLKKEGFSKFWTKDKTQALLGIGLIRTIFHHGPSWSRAISRTVRHNRCFSPRKDILESENSKGEIKYGKVAELLSDVLHLDKKLNAEQISSRIAILTSSYKRETDREARSGIQSTWRWKSQLAKLDFQKVPGPGITFFKSKDTDDSPDLRPSSADSLSVPLRTVERPGLITTLKSSSNTTLASNENDETESENEDDQERPKTPDRKIEPKDETDSPLAERAGLLPGERRGRMPDQHVGMF